MTPKFHCWILTVLFGASINSAFAAGPAVEAKDGNIFLRTGEGASKQLTKSGRDSDPLLSPDRQWIVFVRTQPGKATGSDDGDATELWQIRADGSEPILLVKPRVAEDVKEGIDGFSSLQFSTDGRQVFFVTAAYATSGAVHVVDTTKRKEHFVMAGNSVEVVPSGDYRDCLLVEQHRYFIGGGSYDWIWLFKPDGKEVGPVGEDAENFKATYVEK